MGKKQNKQTNKNKKQKQNKIKTNKQTNKEAKNLTNRQDKKQTNKQTNKHDLRYMVGKWNILKEKKQKQNNTKIKKKIKKTSPTCEI